MAAGAATLLATAAALQVISAALQPEMHTARAASCFRADKASVAEAKQTHRKKSIALQNSISNPQRSLVRARTNA